MKTYLQRVRDRRGATAVIVAILIVVLIGFAALALDIGHLVVVRNELQNAADAGALAGTRVLFTADAGGNEIVNPGANAEAERVSKENKSDNAAVEVDLATDVRTGHWDGSSFTSSTPANEADTTYINAVQVTAHKSSAYSIFASIFGVNSFTSQASAVAYRGWAGEDVKYDQPIAICRDKITDSEGKYICSKGRMINSGGNPSTSETGRWTNFSEGCAINANQPNITSLVCGDIQPVSVTSVSTLNGEAQPSMDALYRCWNAATSKTEPWFLKLPVVDCTVPVVCSKIVGAVKVKVVWVTPNGNDPQYNNIPVQMEDWSRSANCSGMALGTSAGRRQCWNNFVAHFKLSYIDSNGVEQPANYLPVTLYFVPDCEYDSLGGPGGEEFNVHAQYPKLVQ